MNIYCIKIAVTLHLLAFSVISVKSQVVTINEELADLLKINEAVALAPAEEIPVGKETEEGEKGYSPVHGAHFDPSKAFILEPKYLENSFKAAKIVGWSFRGRAPWTGGMRSEFIILDRFGKPMFYFHLLDTQPDLVEFRQVVDIDNGIVSFGQEGNLFTCEIVSKGLASAIRETVENQPRKKFVPEEPPRIRYYGRGGKEIRKKGERPESR